MKSKLAKICGESHKEYQRRCIEHEKQRTTQKYANRRQTLAYFESVRKGEIQYKQPTNPLPARNAKGRTVHLKPKVNVIKYDI